jgi:ankyrin repeat protein
MTAKRPKRKERPGVDRAGRTPLHYAALDGSGAEVRRLLEEGADPSAPDDDGRTPLHFAAQGWHVETAEALLSAGAQVDPKDSRGNTPLGDATYQSQARGEMIALLRARGADPNAKNKHGVSPLELARTIANYDVAQYFADLP